MKRRDFMQLFGATAALLGSAQALAGIGESWADDMPHVMVASDNAEIVRVLAMAPDAIASRRPWRCGAIESRDYILQLKPPGRMQPLCEWRQNVLLPFDWSPLPGEGIIGRVEVWCSRPREVAWCVFYLEGREMKCFAGGRS